MIRGIGIDMVQISRMRQILEKETGASFVRRTFTEAERSQAGAKHAPAEYYATRFAAKEAVFKAVAHLTGAGAFDFRIVETLNDGDGCPCITITQQLIPILAQAHVTTLHISITTEGDYASAFVVAVDD